MCFNSFIVSAEKRFRRKSIEMKTLITAHTTSDCVAQQRARPKWKKMAVGQKARKKNWNFMLFRAIKCFFFLFLRVYRYVVVTVAYWNPCSIFSVKITFFLLKCWRHRCHCSRNTHKPHTHVCLNFSLIKTTTPKNRSRSSIWMRCVIAL